MKHQRTRSMLCAALSACTIIAVAPSAHAVGSSSPVDRLGRPTAATQQAVLAIAHNPATPPKIATTLTQAVSFLAGTGKPGGPALPDNAPHFTQFAWPTMAHNCINGSQKAVATAIAVPGPADLPLPGVPANSTSFVFTILGTGTVSPAQETPLVVHWANLNTGRTGTTPLTFGGINPEGPATVNATAHTGAGTIAAAITGAVTTIEDGKPSTCQFLPTVGITNTPAR